MYFTLVYFTLYSLLFYNPHNEYYSISGTLMIFFHTSQRWHELNKKLYILAKHSCYQSVQDRNHLKSRFINSHIEIDFLLLFCRPLHENLIKACFFFFFFFLLLNKVFVPFLSRGSVIPNPFECFH